MIMANGASDRDEYGVGSENLADQLERADAQVIQPEQFHNEEIYRVYLSANRGIANFKDAFRSAILDEGDLLIECCDREIDLAKIMGRINVADAVIIAVNALDSIIANHQCNSCILKDKCDKANDGNCSCFIFEFEYYYALSCNKEIRFILLSSSNDYNSTRDEKIENFYVQLPNSIKRTVIIDNKDALASVYRNFRSELKGRHLGLSIKNEHESDKILRVLNECVQLGGVPQTIGQYTITSGEMNANAGSEIHILTNEMRNYDFTALSSLTISINTKKGVQYYYYGNKETKAEFELFKTTLPDFYEKRFKARQRVVAWIRQAKFDYESFSDFLNIISFNKTIRGIVTYLLMQCSQIDKINDILALCDEGLKSKPYKTTIDSLLDIDCSRLKKWITWRNKDFTDDSGIYKYIDKLSVLIEPLKSNEHIINKAFIKEFLTKLEALNNMALLTRWQAPTDDVYIKLSETEIEDLINFFKYKDSARGGEDLRNVIISEPIEEWLKPKKGEIIGAERTEFMDQDIDRYLQNMHFCLIEDNNPFILAYNFVLFLGYNPKNKSKDSAAWYTTYINNDNTSTNIVIDNAILMVDIDEKLKTYMHIQDIYKQLIVSNESAITELRKTNSRILQCLGIGE